MEYISLAIIGGILFFLTSVFDYYLSRISSEQTGLTDTPTSPSEIPVGSKPNKKEETLYASIEPRYAGYLLAILFQLPALGSKLGLI
jgi:hypothetical protein